MGEVDVLKLPWDIRQKLAQLDLELAEGLFWFFLKECRFSNKIFVNVFLP